MAKFTEFNEETRRSLEQGMNTLTDAVKVIPGPRGHNVVLEKKRGVPTITNDGVSIVKKTELDDPYEEIGAELVREATEKTDDVAGDGTTTAAVVVQVTIREGLCSVTAGANPTAPKKGIEAAVVTITEELPGLAIDVETKEQIAVTAPISAANPSVGGIIAETMNKVSREGVITAEESNTFGLGLEPIRGMRFDKGYVSPYFVTDAERMEATLDNPYVLIINSKISSLKDLLPVLEKVMQSGRSLLVVAEDVGGETLADPIVDELRGIFKPTTVKAPGFGDRHETMLSDIAILIGGQVIVEKVDPSLEIVTLSLPNRTHQVTATRDGYTIVDGNGTRVQIEGHVAQIRHEIESSDSNYDREKLQERLAKLTGGATVIKAGATIEVELRERKHRIENAVRNTKAAVEEGTVSDSGVILLQTSEAAKVEGLNDDEMVGMNIVFTAAQAPLRQIAMNAGLEGGVIAEKVAGLPKGHGLDAATGEYVNTAVTGIVDPAKVTHSVLQNTTPIAVPLPTTEAIIVDKPEKAPATADAPGMDKMDGMGGF